MKLVKISLSLEFEEFPLFPVTHQGLEKETSEGMLENLDKMEEHQESASIDGVSSIVHYQNIYIWSFHHIIQFVKQQKSEYGKIMDGTFQQYLVIFVIMYPKVMICRNILVDNYGDHVRYDKTFPNL